MFSYLLRDLLIKQTRTFMMAIILLFSSCGNDEYSEPSSTSLNKGSSPSNGDVPMRWSQGDLGVNGLSLLVSSELTAEFSAGDYDGDDHSPVQQMMKAWNGAIDDLTFFNINASSETSSSHQSLIDYNDNEMGIYLTSDWFDDVSNSALAITQFFGIRQNVGETDEFLELFHADIFINFEYFDFEIGASQIGTYDLSSVLLHEMGHFLGLNHQSMSSDSVMRPYLDINTLERELYSLDTTTLRENYQVSSSNAVRGTSLILGAMGSGAQREEQPDEYVHGIIELRANGKCHHIINGEDVYQH